VPPYQDRPSPAGYLQSALQDGTQYGAVEIPDGEADDIHRRKRPAAHGIDIAQRIGSGDPPKIEGIVDDGREKIEGLDQGDLIAEAVYPGIIGRLESNQKTGVLFGFQIF
jgi:hypothetical protein